MLNNILFLKLHDFIQLSVVDAHFKIFSKQLILSLPGHFWTTITRLFVIFCLKSKYPSPPPIPSLVMVHEKTLGRCRVMTCVILKLFSFSGCHIGRVSTLGPLKLPAVRRKQPITLGPKTTQVHLLKLLHGKQQQQTGTSHKTRIWIRISGAKIRNLNRILLLLKNKMKNRGEKHIWTKKLCQQVMISSKLFFFFLNRILN